MFKRSLFISGLAVLALTLSGCDAIDRLQQSYGQLEQAKQTIENINQQINNRENIHVVIVPGYGSPVKGNKTYQKYIQTVADYVTNTDNKITAVVFTGGYSSSPDMTEAEAMNRYFNSIVDTATLRANGVKILKEECAIVSWQNIANSKELLDKQTIHPSSVTIFGDSNRADKLTSFASYKFNLANGLPNNVNDVVSQALNAVTVDFKGFDFGSTTDTQDERNARFAAEIGGAYDTQLGNDILAQRLDAWTTQYGYSVRDKLVANGCSEYTGFQQ